MEMIEYVASLPPPTRSEPSSDNDEECPVCHGMGYICAECHQPDGDCICADGPDLIRCPEGCE